MNPEEARSATLWMRAASGLEVLTGLGLVVAPSLLSRLLFGSSMNQIGDSVGRIAGLVMLCLAPCCWPRGSEARSRQALAPLIALSVLAALISLLSASAGRRSAHSFGLPRRAMPLSQFC
jgi:uncharacterized protein YjeT (DUF2065 family)